MLQSTGWPRAQQDLVTEEQQQCRITAGTKEVLKGECTSFLLSLSLSLRFHQVSSRFTVSLRPTVFSHGGTGPRTHCDFGTRLGVNSSASPVCASLLRGSLPRG